MASSKARDGPRPDDVDAEDRPRERRRTSTSKAEKQRDRDAKGAGQPSPSSLSSLLSSTLHGHKASPSSARPPKVSRVSESDLVFPSSSSLSRGHRYRERDRDRDRDTRERDVDRDRDRDRDSPKGRTSAHHRPSAGAHRSSRRRTKDRESLDPDRLSPVDDSDTRDSKERDNDTTSEPRSIRSTRSVRSARSISNSAVDLVVPEMARSRDRLPYPTVNKAFSRETVGSRDDLSVPGSRRTDPLTPDATDVSAGAANMHRSKSTSAAGATSTAGVPLGVKTARAGSRLSPLSSSTPPSRQSSRRRADERPPSPPDTNISSGKGEAKEENAEQDAQIGGDDDDESRSRRRSSAAKAKKPARGGTATPQRREASPVHIYPPSSPDDSKLGSIASSQATYKGIQPFPPPPPPPQAQAQATTSRTVPHVVHVHAVDGSDADLSPESANDSASPKTPHDLSPNMSPNFYASGGWKKQQQHQRQLDGSVHDDGTGPEPSPAPSPAPGSEWSGTPAPTDSDPTASVNSAIPPAPPPPPPLNILEVPRIDYLMQNGGLPHALPKNFLAALPRQNGIRPSNPPLQGAQTLFAPFFNVLGQYQSVLQNHGSVAVAIGHRTVARRLLDRLENVFSRELPPDGCSCVVCEHGIDGLEYHRGLGWGEVLERVSGRIDLPAWPPLNIAALEQRLDAAAVAAAAVGAGSTPASNVVGSMPPLRPPSPVKIDPDIAEEFREHYLRQTKKVRASVDRWMRNCADAPASPPQEIDDETLAFAILTNLSQEDRPLFNALLTGSRELQPTIRAPTPMRKPRQDFIVKTGLALQRLYRLSGPPRDAETTLYLVKNPSVHDLLHTIADIHPSEWEILISGRFDGFLWSGADEDEVATPIASDPVGLFPTGATPSRGPTPAGGIGGFHGDGPGISGPGLAAGLASLGGMNSPAVSRNATPASFASGYSAATSAASAATRQAVSTDEEAEVAALAEVEREIYTGMEALEDAFETLHRRAEAVRTALRQRSAGLSMRLQQRRGGGLGAAAARIDVQPISAAPTPGPDQVQAGPGGGPGPSSLGSQWGTLPSRGPSNLNLHSFFSDGVMPDDNDWDAGEDFFELKPEDSASNISSAQHRRPKRRSERRTPAPIEEEDE